MDQECYLYCLHDVIIHIRIKSNYCWEIFLSHLCIRVSFMQGEIPTISREDSMSCYSTRQDYCLSLGWGCNKMVAVMFVLPSSLCSTFSFFFPLPISLSRRISSYPSGVSGVYFQKATKQDANLIIHDWLISIS